MQSNNNAMIRIEQKKGGRIVHWNMFQTEV